MISPELLKVLDSNWVRHRTDTDGNMIWGYELIDGAPEDITQQFDEFTELLYADFIAKCAI